MVVLNLILQVENCHFGGKIVESAPFSDGFGGPHVRQTYLTNVASQSHKVLSDCMTVSFADNFNLMC